MYGITTKYQKKLMINLSKYQLME